MIGYEFLLSHIPLRMPPLSRPAQVRPVTRIEEMPDLLAVPRHVAPAADASMLEHILFALKHESMRQAILHEALKLVPEEAMASALTAQRTGAYLRKAAFIWEKAHGRELPLPWDTTGGNYLDVFDRSTYYTGPVWERSPRFRVNFNGIGPYEFCPVVRKSPALEQRGRDVLERLHTWAANPANAEIVDRVMSWAYLSETRDSYAIENESPSPDKERAFLGAMQHLRDRRDLSEDYLVELQNVVITNDLKLEFAFRNEQNWLQRGGHGALAVRYIPPPPDHVAALTAGLVRMANAREGDVPPMVKAALVSFGFVFIHPFIDGNDFIFEFRSSPAVYAHWDGDAAAAFVTACAELALEQSLIDETSFIQAYDGAFDQIDRAFDLPNRTINLLIQWIRQNNGRLPERRKSAAELTLLKPEELARIEAIVADCFRSRVERP